MNKVLMALTCLIAPLPAIADDTIDIQYNAGLYGSESSEVKALEEEVRKFLSTKEWKGKISLIHISEKGFFQKKSVVINTKSGAFYKKDHNFSRNKESVIRLLKSISSDLH
jgi:hypothetical protein